MQKSPKHTIDFLFPIALFLVFASTAMIVLLLSANNYKNIVNDSDASFTRNTALSYITEKIRQNDSSGSKQVFLSKFDGCDALTIVQNYGETSYTTYIYEQNDELKELFMQSDIKASASSGTTIMKISELEMSELSAGIYKFSCTAENGSSDSVIISLRSNP